MAGWPKSATSVDPVWAIPKAPTRTISVVEDAFFSRGEEPDADKPLTDADLAALSTAAAPRTESGSGIESGGISDIVELAARPPTPEEMKGIAQEFSVVIRLNKKQQASKFVAVAVALIIAGGIAGLAWYFSTQKPLEPAAPAAQVVHRAPGSGIEVTSKSLEPAAAPVRQDRRPRVIATNHVELDQEALARANAQAETEVDGGETITVTMETPAKGGAARAKVVVGGEPKVAASLESNPALSDSPPGQATPLQKRADEVVKALAVGDSAGKIEAAIALPSLGNPTTGPAVTSDQVDNLIARSLKKFSACKTDDLPAKVRLSFSITLTGEASVNTIEVDGMVDPTVGGCLKKLVGQWQFPRSDKATSFSKIFVI